MTFSFTPYPDEPGRVPSCYVATNFVGFAPNASGSFTADGTYQGSTFPLTVGMSVSLDANGSGTASHQFITAKTSVLTGEFLGVAATPATVSC
jgi:hypothetical protein